MNRRRLILLLVTLLPSAVLIIAAAVYIVVQANRVADRLDVTLKAELQNSLRREVRIGRVRTKPLGTLVIRDFAIADGKTFAAGTMLAAERVEVKYRWLALVLRRGPAIQTITSVRLIRPRGRIIHLRAGEWNLTPLFKPKPGPRRPPFTGVVTIVDGRALVRDDVAGPPGRRPAINRISRINGTLDASTSPLLSFAGTMTGDTFRRADVNGRYNGRRKSLDISISAKDGDARFWSAYRPVAEPFRVISGKLDADILVSRVTRKGLQHWDYSGSARLRQVAGTAPQLSSPITQVSGRVDFSTELATIDLRGVAARSPLRARGTIVLQPRQSLRIALESKSLDVASLVRSLPQSEQFRQLRFSGRGSASTLIVGPPSKLSVRGTARIPQAAFSGYTATDINLSASYAGGIIRLSRGTARTLGGSVTAAGFFDLRDRRNDIDLTGTAKGINLARVPALRQSGLSGVADAGFAVTGSVTRPIVQASVRAPGGVYNKVAFRGATANVQVAGGVISIRSLTASTSGGAVRLSGTVTKERADLDINALGIDMSVLLARLGYKDYSGVGYFQGRISGPISDPTVVGTAEVFKGKVGSIDFDYARGHIAGNRRAIALSDTTIKRYPGEATVSGRILSIATPRPQFDLAVEVKQASIKDLLEMTKAKVAATGLASGSFAVTGTWPLIRIGGSFAVTDAKIGAYALTSVTGSVVYAGGTTTISDLVARTNGTTIDASGTVAGDGRIQMAFSGQGIPLTALNESLKPYLVLAGTADVSGTVGGTVKTPTVTATVESLEPEVNAQKFSRFTAKASWDGSAATLSDVVLTAGEESYTISSLAYNPKEKFVNAEAATTNGQIERFLGTVRQSAFLATPQGERLRRIVAQIPQPISGAVSASVSLNGKLSQLHGTVQASTSNVMLGRQTIQSAELLITAEQGNVSLTRFSAVSGDLNVTASGDIYKDDRVNLDVEAYNLDLSLLRPWTGQTAVSGIATITALVSGPIKSPSIQASVEMVSPTISGFKFDRIRASQILVSMDRIEISDVILTKDAYRALLAGTLPWDWGSLSVPSDKPIEMHAELEQQSLALLAALSDAIEVEGTGGTVDANVDVRGTINRPDLEGSFTIADGSVNLKAFQTAEPEGPSDFRKINANASFSQDRVNIVTLKGEAAKGGSFSVSGTIGLADFPNGSLDLVAISDRLYFSEQNLSGIYNELITARLTTNLTAKGTVRQPLVAGSAQITDAQIRLTAKETAGSRPPIAFPVNPSFDVALSAGKDVWFYNPSLRAMITGTATLGGTALVPAFRGTMVVQRGTIRLPTTRLDIRRGGRITFAYVPPEQSRVILDLQATTSTTARSPLGGQRRYNIVIDIRGPLDSLALNARSEPPGLTQDRIYAMLGHVEGLFDTGELALRQELTDIFTAAVVPGVFGPIETAFEQAFGLEEFRLEYSREEPLAVYVSRHLFGDFYGSYWRTVTSPGATTSLQEQYRLSLSYRWTDKLQFSLITNDQNESIVEVEGALRY